MPADILIIREYQYDPERCLRALRALLASPTKDADRPSPSKVKSGRAEPARVSSGAHSIQHRRRRVKAARHAELP